MGILVHPFLWVMQGSYHQAQGVGFLGPKPQKKGPRKPNIKADLPKSEQGELQCAGRRASGPVSENLQRGSQRAQFP